MISCTLQLNGKGREGRTYRYRRGGHTDIGGEDIQMEEGRTYSWRRRGGHTDGGGGEDIQI